MVILVFELRDHWVAVLGVLAAHFLPAAYQVVRMTISRTYGSNVMMPIVLSGMLLVTAAQRAIKLGLLLGALYLAVTSDQPLWRWISLGVIYWWLVDFEVDRYFRFRRRLAPEISGGLSREPLNRLIMETAGRFSDPAILDVACGDGTAFVAYAAKELEGTAGSVVGVDSNAAAIAAGKARQPELDLRVGSACELPFEDESFDVVISFGGVNQQSMGSRAMEELFRVCRTGGTVFLLDEQLARGASWLETQHFYRTIVSISSNTWMLEEAPVNYLPAIAGNISLLQAGACYYTLRADKLQPHEPSGRPGGDSAGESP